MMSDRTLKRLETAKKHVRKQLNRGLVAAEFNFSDMYGSWLLVVPPADENEKDTNLVCSDELKVKGVRLKEWPDLETVSVALDNQMTLPEDWWIDDKEPICWIRGLTSRSDYLVIYRKETWEQRARRLLSKGKSDD
jgi:hypothetical protein